jgi:basic amino acid/polyamine antiporter, APA family
MKLKKELKLIDVFCIASGAMISSGLFILPGIAHSLAGPAVTLSYLIAGFLALTGLLSQAELASAMPKAGGTYFYVNRTMGPAVGTVDGILTWFSLCLKTSFALVGMSAFLAIIVSLDIRVIGVVLCLIFLIINIIGIKEASRIQIVLVFGLFIILAAYILFGLPAVKAENIVEFLPHGMGAVFSTAGLVFVSFGGLLKVASIAEEVKDPAKTVPLGMIFAFVVVTIFYILVIFVTSGVLPKAELNNSLAPISLGASVFWGTPGKIILSIAAILAFVSTANAGIMASSRYPLALGRDKLMPKFLMKISPKFKTPYIALIITTIFIALSLFFKLELLIKTASTVLILTFIFSCLCVIIMRESKLQNYRPKFKSPLYPWVQIIGIIGSMLLIFEMGVVSLLICVILIIGSLFVYFFYGRKRSNKEFALLHLIERITNKELTSRYLENELRDIIRERDEIVTDRFDELIESSIVLDIEKSINLNEFIKLASTELALKLNLRESFIHEKLMEREKEGSTVISDNLAIPHIIIEGTNKFVILLARCKDGIKFNETSNCVKTVFVLMGTKDERNFHLRALSAIAQVVQDPLFEEKWNSAKNIEDLKDTVLLVKRKRNN